MRIVVVAALAMLCACASDKLALAPPAGVDFSGHWQLNEADSDDPQHLLQNQNADPSKVAASSRGQGGQGGQGGRGGRQGGRGGPADMGAAPGPPPPSPAVVRALGEGLRWPGKELEIKQVAGVVALTSAGVDRVFQPMSETKPLHRRKAKDDTGPRNRDMPARDRGDGPPSACGWEGKTLVVQSREADDDHPPFEKRYSLSDDGGRLFEAVGFAGGRGGGFTLSRVWDRVTVGSAPTSLPPTALPPTAPVP